jgi:hypothetical protein
MKETRSDSRLQPGYSSLFDGITDYLKQHWPAIREQLLSGTYEPKFGDLTHQFVVIDSIEKFLQIENR